MPGLYIGLMSGTSLDGVDGVLAELGEAPAQPLVLASAHLPMPPALRQEFLALNSAGPDELHRAALAANALVGLYADVVGQLLVSAGKEPTQVQAMGAHGQTVRHQPQAFDGIGYTVQLNQAALLAERCGITVVADFRSRDLAAGGQGAPLVPPFHLAVFGDAQESRAVLNIGGISNLTLLPAGAANSDGAGLLGFDCGPGNALMDAWCERHTGAVYDDQGQWAAQGQVDAGLLGAMQQEAFFRQAPPKSTGRDLFNAAWLGQHLAAFPASAPVDVQATLTELTAWACAQASSHAVGNYRRLLVCGGGARNAFLMQRLKALLPGIKVSTTQDWGVAPSDVEALAFAWLAQQALHAKTASVAAVTGARGARILGAIYRA
jgi:anhydro-N-acetylmuramic acid kinase